MPLLPYLAPSFTPAARAAGEVLADAVYITSTSRPDHVTAFVRGAPEARMELRRAGRRVTLTCRCMESARAAGQCEHTYALVLYLDRSEPEIVEHLEGAAAAQFEADRRTAAPPKPTPPRPSTAPPRDKGWEDTQARLARFAMNSAPEGEAKELVYVFGHPDHSHVEDGLELQIGYRRKHKNGKLGEVNLAPLSRQDLTSGRGPEERALIDALLGRGLDWVTASTSWYHEQAEHRIFQLRAAHDRELVRDACATGRAFLQFDGAAAPLRWCDEPCEARVVVAREGSRVSARVVVFRSGVRDPDPPIPCGAGVALRDATFHPFEEHGMREALIELFAPGPLEVPEARAADLVGALLALPLCPPLEVPDDLRFTDETRVPVPELAFEGLEDAQVTSELGFWYDAVRIAHGDCAGAVVDPERRARYLRDPAAEGLAAARLGELGFKPAKEGGRWSLARTKLAAAVRTLVAEGWRVLADKRALVLPGEFTIKVSSGIDWFDLQGHCAFGIASLSIRRLFEQKQRESGFVPLGDGSYGLVPEEWLGKHEALLALAEADTDADAGLRVPRSRGVFLAALLAERQQVQADGEFRDWRERISRMATLAAREPPDSFRGTLRPYQKEALGWFAFLRDLGISGCLADDMGLGKTVQVLALLEERRRTAAPGTRRTSLVVAPRSLVFHWDQEARRFAPGLTVLDFARADRQRDAATARDFDLVLTTYGTLRRDVELLSEITFDYVILDEAQAIKNASSQAAKAACLLRADHRLALSGTPVENHVGELVSLFEFLNPGLLSSTPALQKVLRGATANPESRSALGRALRPFLLRRTKQQVAKDLPERVEETLWCELGEAQRAFYDAVKETVRADVLTALENGIEKSLAAVLTGLLRLRQAACDPRLIDARRRAGESAKLEILVERLVELREEGQKALVFSQFTSLLALVKERLDGLGIRHEYLDGATRDRGARVAAFQTDPGIQVFLISLKAGGLGLTLTAASYVFLLDPWWNPAVEAQAIDRAHRIGQSQRVIAFRMIARDTIEERILELQGRKRALADAILGAESGPLAKLTREDLELLFG